MAGLQETLVSFEAIGVVDDDSSEAELYKYQIEDIGIRPILFGAGFASLEDLVGKIRSAKVDAVVCDHRLRVRDYAPFNGAEAVARLFEIHIPAVLISRYTRIDVDMDIRPYRKKIPVLLSKDEVDSESLLVALGQCKAELDGNVPTSRRPQRTLVRIDDVTQDLAVAFVPGWNPNEAVRFPRSVVPEPYRSALQPDDRFFTNVNIDAEKADDLFFENFEPAPTVSPEDDIFS
jgi:CheY-like chemotaxis protein